MIKLGLLASLSTLGGGAWGGLGARGVREFHCGAALFFPPSKAALGGLFSPHKLLLLLPLPLLALPPAAAPPARRLVLGLLLLLLLLLLLPLLAGFFA